MIIDKRLEFADATALNTGAAGTYLIGDVIDLGVARDIGGGEYTLYWIIRVDTTVTSGGGATSVKFSLASDAQAAIATDGTATVHAATGAIPKATLVAGYYVASIPVPAEGMSYERYLGVLQTTVGVDAVTAGKVDAYISHQKPRYTAWADSV